VNWVVPAEQEQSDVPYQLTPFAVDLPFLRGLVGSRRRSLVKELKRLYGHNFTWIDQCLEDEEDQLSPEDVLKQMLAGRPLDPAWGAQFYAILEMFCGYYGRRLDCREFGSPNWIRRVDEAIHGAGVRGDRFGLERHLINRGSPVPFPGSLDSSVGYLETAEVVHALNAFHKADFSELKADLRAGAAEVHSWLAYCSTAGRDLVTFYYL
jgi:hypothetical protein